MRDHLHFPRVSFVTMTVEFVMTLETCKLRYCRPSETDWLVERLSRSEADLRKLALEQRGCIVELIDPLGNSAASLHARFGARLDPRRIMN